MSSLDDLRDALVQTVAPVDDDEVIIARLAGLKTLAYGRVRDAEAKALGVSLACLDKAVREYRQSLKLGVGKPVEFVEPIPWAESVCGEDLIVELSATFKRFVICSDDMALAASLYVVMTYFVDVLDIMPLAIITAPEKRCGKTTALEVMGDLVYRPLLNSSITPAALFRSLEQWEPTLLIDETDRFLKDSEAAIGILNAGYRRKAGYVMRCVGDNHEVRRFSCFGAKVLSGIGVDLPDTILDRAIFLELRRKMSDEQVDNLRHADASMFENLRSRIARFALDRKAAMRSARPALPSSLNDRAQELWEPLVAIAEFSGGDWPVRAIDTAVRISGKDEAVLSIGTELLLDIRATFERFNDGRVRSVDLLNDLISDEEKPWATYRGGKPINLRWLGLKLAGFGIKSKTLRFHGTQAKGFERVQFDDAFNRYLPVFAVPLENSLFLNELGGTDKNLVTYHAVPFSDNVNDGTACDVTVFHAVPLKPLISKDFVAGTAKSGNGGVKDVGPI